jgi:hypothetical protein
MHCRTLIVLAASLLFCLTAPNGFGQCAAVNVDMVKGQLTANPGLAPPSGACHEGQHVTWVTGETGALNIIFDDAHNPEPFPKPTCGGQACSVTVPHVSHADARRYKYIAEVKYADNHVAKTVDPEIVVAGGRLGGHRKRTTESSDKRPYPPVVPITITVSGNSVTAFPPAPTVHLDQRVHWHAKSGRVDHIQFQDPVAGSVPCTNNECERGVANLTPNRHYPYNVVVVDEKGNQIKSDPEIVIAGTGTRGHGHKRMAKH